MCLLVYPSVPLLLLSLLPTGLGILWTTGIASFYPGEVNLISLSFIAILAGLGDDQVVHFFNRSPQEWAKGGSLTRPCCAPLKPPEPASCCCILTAAPRHGRAGHLQLQGAGGVRLHPHRRHVHDDASHPADRARADAVVGTGISKPLAPQAITFRFLPAVARGSVDFVGRHARAWSSRLPPASFCSRCWLLPAIKMGGQLSSGGGADSPAVAAQNLLSAKFGIEGSPDAAADCRRQQEVLRRAEESDGRPGILSATRRPSNRSSLPPSLLPSVQTQKQRAASLTGMSIWMPRPAPWRIRCARTAFVPSRIFPISSDCASWESARNPLRWKRPRPYLPAGLLDNSIRKTGDGSYVAAIAFYATDPNAHEAIPERGARLLAQAIWSFCGVLLRQDRPRPAEPGPHDSRRALLWTAAAIVPDRLSHFPQPRASLCSC